MMVIIMVWYCGTEVPKFLYFDLFSDPTIFIWLLAEVKN